jgi:UDP-2,4-diacetamido-2,4,6-trideoxy-beta-L-altropyranose hydrolase
MPSGPLPRIILRADAGPGIGLGHLMRSVAIGQEWQDRGGGVTIVTTLPAGATARRLESEGFAVRPGLGLPGSMHDAVGTAEIAASLGARWIVLDGYHFGEEYQRVLKERGFRVLAVDDYGHAGSYHADIVLNQNLSAREEVYGHRDPGTRVLLGPRYAMIRREFRESGLVVREHPEIARNLLVSLGGSDQEKVTQTIVQALELLGEDAPCTTMVLGETNPLGDDLAEALRALPGCTVVRGGEHMPAVMAGVDAAITGGGSTTWELLFMQVPFLTMVLAANQAPVARALEAAGLTWNLGEGRDLTPKDLASVLSQFLASRKVRADLSGMGRKVVDGHGTSRILMHLLGDPLWLREAEEGDCCIVWEWANDPVVRQASFHPAPILWEDHELWFSRKVSDPDCLMFIAIDREDRSIGQIRFDLAGRVAEVDLSIDGRFRGRGLGTHLLQAGLSTLRRKGRTGIVKGYVKTGNLPSIRSFEDAGFISLGTAEVQGTRCIEFELEL